MFNKGKFTRLDVSDDGTIWLAFEYKRMFGKIKYEAKDEITSYLKKYFKGLKDVSVKLKPNHKELYISINIQKVGDDALIVWLDDQEKALKTYCDNY